jgi:hypothetical protein
VQIVLIHLGSLSPRHLRACAAQVETITGRKPAIVGRMRAWRLRGPKLRRFRDVESLTELGLRGFWRYSAERFFVLEDFMAEAGLERCLHIESDNLLYVDPARYAGWLQDNYGGGIAVTPLTDDEDTAALMSVGSRAALSAFNAALLDLVTVAPAELIERFGGPMANEMRMLRILRGGGLAAPLPTTLASARAVDCSVVFDPGSYGQCVDGIPSRPGVSYVGDHHGVGRELLGKRCRVVWDAERRTPSVLATDGTEELPLANLHVHSKRLDRFVTEAEPPAPSRDSRLGQLAETARLYARGARKRARGR